jgi:hypothetical protein
VAPEQQQAEGHNVCVACLLLLGDVRLKFEHSQDGGASACPAVSSAGGKQACKNAMEKAESGVPQIRDKRFEASQYIKLWLGGQLSQKYQTVQLKSSAAAKQLLSSPNLIVP